MGSQFLIGIVLARLLGPEPFGLVALAWLVLGLGNLVADFGLTSALIQCKEVTPNMVRYVFTLQTLAGFILTCLIGFGADWIADFFHQPKAKPVLQVMSLLFLLQALGQTAMSLLRRNLDFRRSQLAQFSSYLFGYVCLGLPLAFSGMGVWSLVIAQLSQSFLYSFIVYVMVKHPVKPTLQGEGKSLFKFGSKVMASNLSNWGISSLDNAVVGRVFGVTDLGLYNRAYNLVSTPMSAITTSLQGVLFAASSRAQDDKATLCRTYLAALGVIGFICLPVFFTVAVIPDTVILAVYGPLWSAATPLLAPLAIATLLQALLSVGGPMMLGIGRADRELNVQLVTLAVLVLALFWAYTRSIEAVAWTIVGVSLLRFLLVTGATLSTLNGRWIEVRRVLQGPLFLSACCVIVVFSIDCILRKLSLPIGIRLLIDIGFGSLSFMSIYVLGKRWLVSPALAWFFEKLETSLPTNLRWLVKV